MTHHDKCPVLVTHDLETYYAYIAAYMPDDENALNGGMYINHGYGHFVFTYLDISQAEAVLAHELTHSLVSHLPPPAWLNEGVAPICEQAATGRDAANHDDIQDTLGTYWTAETIQDLWSGCGFNRQGEGQPQSYHLAKVLTHMLTGDRPRFLAFLHLSLLRRRSRRPAEALRFLLGNARVRLPRRRRMESLAVHTKLRPAINEKGAASRRPFRGRSINLSSVNLPYLIEISSTSNTSTEPAGIAPCARLP